MKASEREALEYFKTVEDVVASVLSLMEERVEAGHPEINVLACVMTSVLCKHFSSSEEARDALELFNSCVCAVMSQAESRHLTAWMDENATLN